MGVPERGQGEAQGQGGALVPRGCRGTLFGGKESWGEGRAGEAGRRLGC